MTSPGKVAKIYFKRQPCPVCGSKELCNAYPINKAYAEDLSRIDLRGVDIGVDDCLRCGHQFIQPMPRSSFLRAFYSSYMNTASTGLYRERITSDIHPDFRKRFSCWLDEARKLIDSKDPSLLDIGTGLGMFLRLAREKGYKVSGVEPNSEAAELLDKQFGIKVHNCFLEEFSTREKYDIITMWDILEHVAEPVEAVSIVRESLKPKGLFVLEIPVRDSIIHWLAKGIYTATFKQLKRPLYLVYGVHHLQYFTRRSIKDFLEKSGFEVIASYQTESDVKGLSREVEGTFLKRARAVCYNVILKCAFLSARYLGKQNKLIVFARCR